MAEYKIVLEHGPPWGFRFQDDPVQVSAVNPGSKAHRQGIETGDHVVSVNDQPVNDIEQAQQLVRNAGSSLVLQLRRAPRAAPTFSRPSRPTFLCESRQATAAAAHAAQPPPDSNLDQQEPEQQPGQQQQRPRTSSGDFSSTRELPTAAAATISDQADLNSTHTSVPAAGVYRPGDSVTGNIPDSLAAASTRSATMIAGNDSRSAAAGETRTFTTSGPPMSPQFKVRSGVKPQVWAPTTSVRAAPVVREFYPNSSHHHQQGDHNYPSTGPSHSSLSTLDDRIQPISTHNGVYSPSSSSSGIMSATNSERTDELPVRGEYEDRSTDTMYRGSTMQQEPHSVMFVERSGSDFSRLPRSQSPTVTLLQKAREGHLNKTPSYAYASQTSDPQDRKYETATSVPSSRGNGNADIIRHTFPAPKYDDIGPTNEKGMPTALRSGIKDDKQHDWYKKMFKAIHKPEDETDFVLVKYQQNSRRRSGYSPTPKNQYLSDAYMSEPELGREDNYPHYSTTSDVETSRDYSDFARTHSLPRTKKDTSSFDADTDRRQNATVVNENPYRHRISPPKTQSQEPWRAQPAPRVEPKSWMPQRPHPEPRRLDTYEPGRSSMSMQEALQDRDWKRQMDLYNPAPEQPTPKYAVSTGAPGGFKPDQPVYRRPVGTRAMSPEEQREIYKEIQKGGDVPLSGLRMPAPQKPIEVNPNELTSKEYAQWRKAFALETLLPEPQTIEAMSWELKPALQSLTQISDKPILRAQPLTKFSFFKSTYAPEDSADSTEYKRLLSDFTDVGRTVPDKIRASKKDFSFFRAVTGSPEPFQPAKPAKPRRRANTLDGRSTHPTDVWLKQIAKDLDTVDQPVKISRENLEKISNPYFRNRLSFQLAVPPGRNRPKRITSRIFHSPICGTIFSSISHLQSAPKPLAQSKTLCAFPQTTPSLKSKPAKKPVPETSSLTVFQKRREERMQRLTRKMFSLSRDTTTAPPVKSNYGRVKNLSQKYETWQRIRSASGSPTQNQRNRKVFSYTQSGALDIWNSRKHARMATSKSLSSITPAPPGEPGQALVKSKSLAPGQISAAATQAVDNPYRHVGFELLESSLSLDDKMTSVSSFTDSGLDYFHRGSLSSLSSDTDGGLYRDFFLTDVDTGFLNGPDVQRMELDIDRLSAPPAKKPLTDSGSRNLSARDYNASYYSTPVRSPVATATMERKSSRSTDYDDMEFDLQKEYRKIDEIYEREREKRQKSKAQDEERRRHNYVPTMTKSPVTSDRYDSVYDDPFNFRPGRPRSVSPGALGFGRRDRARSTSSQGDYFESDLIGPARALYNFTAQNPRELSFRQGDIVQVLRALDQNWIEGECNSRSGIAPASYLESMNSDHRRRMEKVAREGQGRAKYDFNAHNQVEMSIKKGEIIVLIRKVDRNWYEGKIGARRGIFPVAYVEVLKEPSKDAPTAGAGALHQQASLTTPSISPGRPMEPTFVSHYTPTLTSSASSPRKSSTVQEGSDRETFGNHVLKEFKTQVSQSPEGPSATLRRNSANKSSIDELLIPPPPTTSIQEELDLLRRAPERCRVLYAYRKQHEDELELREGETIDVLERCDDGWFNGKNKRGEQGYFPGNYVQSV